MTLRRSTRFALPLSLAVACAATASAQQLIGYVPTRDASVTGSTDELNGQAVLTGSASVTAKDHTAPITLGRGGIVRVCQTSALHISESRSADLAAPLLFSLDRGAIEIATNAAPSDAVMTPDLRFTVRNRGPLDLRLRVARNGDTCVENRGSDAPTLSVSDPFGESTYELAAGQHVLFEHGSLHDVVDRESSPCGCPEPKGMSMADAMLTPAPSAPKGAKTDTPAPPPPAQAAIDLHPFPAAISEGLAPPEPAAPRSATSAPQITDPLVYNGATKDPDELNPQNQLSKLPKVNRAAGPAPVATPAQAALAAAPFPEPPPTPAVAPPKPAAQPAPQQQPQDLVHAVGHFFHKLFGHS